MTGAPNPRSPQPARRLLLACWLGAAALSIYTNLVHFEMLARNDDPYITFRYAENFAAGRGLVYNEGQRVLGTTAPLFALILGCVWFLAPSASIPSTAVGLNLVFHACATLVALLYLAPLLESSRGQPRVLPLLFFLLVTALHPAFTSLMFGMEVGLVILLSVCSLQLLAARRLPLLALTLVLLLATRIDAVLFVSLVLLSLLVWSPDVPLRSRLRTLGLFAALAALLVASTTAYFGSPIPNSIVAKNLVFRKFGAGGHDAPISEFAADLGADVFWGSADQRVLALLFVAGIVHAARRRLRGMLVAAASVAGYSLLLVGFKVTRNGSWYTPQYMLLYTMLCGLGCFSLIGLLVSWTRRLAPGSRGGIRERVVAVVAAAAVTGGVAVPGTAGLARRAAILREVFPPEDPMICLGRALGALSSATGDVALVGDIGKIGYYSQARILDLNGLVSPEVFAYYRDGSGVPGIVQGELPRYIAVYDATVLASETRDSNISRTQYHRWLAQNYAVVETGCDTSKSGYLLRVKRSQSDPPLPR